MAKHKTWFVYVESKETAGKFLYYCETNLGEAEAKLTAEELIGKGSRAMITDQPVGDGFFARFFKNVKI